jgi:peptidoglycan/xylan/chitin deacetylase (PgdA/CDA1 family)
MTALPLQRTAPVRTAWRLPVLMYHSISHAAVETALPGSVSRHRLEEQLTALVEAGWTLVGLTEALRILDREPTRRVVALTFDDGLLDFQNAAEVLARLGARATLYVPTALVGRRESWSDPNATLSWADLTALATAGVEIGSHTCHHRPLDVHPPAVVEREVRDSRHALEDRLGTVVASFSYPHGYNSSNVTDAVARAGYANACVIGRRIAHAGDDRLAIPRVEARPGVTGEEIHDLVGHGERGLAPVAKRVATPAWRLARRTAFTVLHRELT